MQNNIESKNELSDILQNLQEHIRRTHDFINEANGSQSLNQGLKSLVRELEKLAKALENA
ncbi:MAG: hypothetical protein IJG38_02410 [Thermoguttaceae bacterium]|nr:hypothetical protein [Thermoguttaceae bacterium]